MAPGTVLRWMDGPQQGHAMEVQHDGFVTRYLHLSTRLAPERSQVDLGSTIARTGASGMVTGAHLHVELLVDGVLVDPEPLITGAAAPAANVQQPPGDGISAYPLDPGKSCAAGYNVGTVAPGLLAGVPFNLWWNRQTNADGTINACVRPDVAPGTNLAAADAGRIAGDAAAAAALATAGALLPVLVNLGVVVLVVVLTASGARQALGAAAA